MAEPTDFTNQARFETTIDPGATNRRLLAENQAPYGPTVATPAYFINASHARGVQESSGRSFDDGGAPLVVTAFDYHSQLAEVGPDARAGDPRVSIACSTQAEVDGETITATLGGGDYALGVILQGGRAELEQFYVILSPNVSITLDATLEFTTPEGIAKQLYDSVDIELRACVEGEAKVLTSAGAQCDVCPLGSFSFDRVECHACGDVVVMPPGAPGVAWCKATTIYLFSGYWRASNTSTLVRQCSAKLIGACLGGARPQNCRTGHTGPLCGICKPQAINDLRR